MSESSEHPALPEEIRTERILLRPWGMGDVDDVFSYAQDSEWSRYLHLVPNPYSRSDAEKFIAIQILLDRVVHPSWAVTLDGIGIGGINIQFTFKHAAGEIGYSIARAHWYQGLCTEAVGAVIDAAFSVHTDLNRVKAMADARNLASLRVMEKLGMSKEGVLRQNRIEAGTVVDEAWYGILRPEWQALMEARSEQ